MELDLRLVRSFVVLVEVRHFGKAAAQLHLTSSALTKQMQRLERQVGSSLLSRGREGITRLTPEGARFASAAVPLLEHARLVAATIHESPARYTVRIGFPAGSLYSFAARISLASLARDVHQSYPEATFTCTEVDFAHLDTCLPAKDVDVLWTSSAVEHSQVDSIPLQVTAGLVGLVPSVHWLREAVTVSVQTFAAERMLYNPEAPEAWMRPFWLAGVRPRREAQLVETYGATHAATTRDAASRSTVMLTVAMDVDRLTPPGLHVVGLDGASRLRMHAGRRRDDERGAVRALIESMERLPADVCP